MTSKEIDKKAMNFRKEYKLGKADYLSLFKVCEKLGYTVIEFNSVLNERNVADLIEALELEQETSASRGFTYANGEYRLVFINESLSEKEKIIVLSHELGHIVLGHLSRQTIVGQDVQEEFEANEFSNFLLKSDSKTFVLLNYHRKGIFLSAFLIILLAAVLVFASSQDKQTPVTDTNAADTETASGTEAAPEGSAKSAEDDFAASDLYSEIRRLVEANLSTIGPSVEYDAENHLINITGQPPEGTRLALLRNKEAVQTGWNDLCDNLTEVSRATYVLCLENDLKIGCTVMLVGDDDKSICLFAAMNGDVYCNIGL